jgi:hypothetical protein
MSLSHQIFSLPEREQDEAIRTLAKKFPSRRRFDGYIHDILHAKHAAGVSNQECYAIKRRWLRLYREVMPLCVK